MVHRVESKGLKAEYPVSYVVGAGTVGYSYLVSIAPYLFQSPVSYYSQTGNWDVTPGYEPEPVLDFTHPIVEGCVFCHAGTINTIAGTDNRFSEPAITSISCERCHGPSQEHLARPVAGSIINPAKLPHARRDSVCEQCHLEGETRILQPGKHWRDFRAGAELESVFVTYVRRFDAKDGVKAVSQVEQLALSRCARESEGRLWCGTCHNPHGQVQNRAEQVRGICLSCHSTLFTAEHHKPASECVSCHMPRIRPNNIAHAAITDHVIALPHSGTNLGRDMRNPELSPWRAPAPLLAQRDLGLALFEAGAAAKNLEWLGRAYDILAHLTRPDAEVLGALGSLLLQQKHPALAAQLLQQAITMEPSNARLMYARGVALAEQSSTAGAIEALRKSIELDPSLPEPYRELARLYERTGRKDLAKQALRDYLRFMPQNLTFRHAAELHNPGAR